MKIKVGKKFISIFVICLLIAVVAASVVLIVIKIAENDKNRGNNSSDPIDNPSAAQRIAFNEGFSGKVGQWYKDLGYVERKIPTVTKNEGLNERYPTYGTVLSNITDDEIDSLLKENSLFVASDSTYDSMDKDGYLFLGGAATGLKLYKHTAATGMYFGDVSDDEKAIVREITVLPTEQRNFVTGLYAPAGEVVKIEISQEDLDAVGGELVVCVGQVSHRNNVNNIWKAAGTRMSRMPVIANKFTIKSTTAYVGYHLGGPIFVYPKNAGKQFTVKISGGVPYFHYIHGQTTREEIEKMKEYSAPYYDFEVWDLGVRFSGPASYGNYDYDNLVKVGDLWEKITRTSRQVPTSANSTISTGYVIDCFVAAGEAVAFQGGHSWINAPPYWLPGALDYDSMVTNGFWGQIHEFNHLYQSYGMETTKTNEVTNNATSLLSYVLYTRISDKRSLNDGDLGGWNRYTDPSRSLRETVAGAANGTKQNALNVYADIIHSFGADNFARAARMQNGWFGGADAWYEALSRVMTDYNFTYYFETMLGQTLSDEKKTLYNTAERTIFVPVATVFQTGRSYLDKGEERFTDTVRPYRIERGEPVEINFNERLVLPADFTFTVKSVTDPQNGRIEKIAENVYKYYPDSADLSGAIDVTIALEGQDSNGNEYVARDVTLRLNFRQYDKNQVETTRYTYVSGTKYSTVEEAVANNFAGYSAEKAKSATTFMNKIANGQIGVVEGKIYVEKTGTYAVCLRSGRGNNTLYLAVNDKSKLSRVLSLDTDHGGFAIEGEHVVRLDLKSGDYLYFKEITLSRHYANDAFTELGIANLTAGETTAKSVPTSVLCTNDMVMPTNDFIAPAKYPRVYTTSETVSETDSTKHTFVSANIGAWGDDVGIGNIFDDDPTNFYHSERNKFISETNPFVLVADIGKIGIYNQITITSRTSNPVNLPCTFSLYGSSDCEEWKLVGSFNNLNISGNVVTAAFDDAEFRYYKLAVTDTKSTSASANKYVTIAKIGFLRNFSGVEKSPYTLEYFKTGEYDFSENVVPSTFGRIIEGNGTIKYSFDGTGILLRVRQNNDCSIRLTIDGKEEIIELSSSGDRAVAFARKLDKGVHDIKIEVLSGRLCVDSVVVL